MQFQVTVTHQQVSYGDHAQDQVLAIESRPNETVQDLVNRALAEDAWYGSDGKSPRPDKHKYLTIRPIT